MKKNQEFDVGKHSGKLRKTFLTMKLSLCFLIMGLTSVYGNAFSQLKVNLTVHNATLQEVFEQLTETTDYRFVYSSDLLNKAQKITCDFQNESIEAVLAECLEGTNLWYRVEDNIVVISPKFQRPYTPMEEITINGKVVDENNQPLPGVAVLLKGTTIGVATDVNGNFQLTIPKQEGLTLVFSFVGMKTQERIVRDEKSITVIMEEETKMIEEVVVTGIQTIEKGRATGSFALLDQKDMEAVYSTSLSEKLEGHVPGLYLNKDNEMVIRGVSTLNANTKPLIVVDGFPMESSELNLNPNDIEQVTVLKDAASASIWGIRAANGVVVVTTKRGAQNKGLQVSYSGNVTYGSRASLDDLHILNSHEYARLDFENAMAQGISEQPYSGRTEIEDIVYKYDNGVLTLDQAYAEVDKLGEFNNQKQIEDNFYRHPFTQQHNLSIQAGGERNAMYISLSFDQNKDTEVGNEYNKYNLLFNNDVYLRKNFTLSLGVRGTYQSIKRNAEDMTEYEPYKRILNDDGTYYNERTSVSEAWQEAFLELGMKDWHKNTLENMRMNDKKTKNYNVSSSLKLEWEPIEGLVLSTQGNYEFGNSEAIDWYSENHYYTRNLTNQYTNVYLDENDYPIEIIENYLPTSGGIRDITNEHTISYSVRNMITWSDQQGEFDYKIMIGNEFYSLEGNSYSDRLWGYDPELLTSQSINLAELQAGVPGYTGMGDYLNLSYAPTSTETLERYTSYFSTASVTWRERYDLFGSIRLDQTNLLTNASEFRNNPSWSVGAKWNIAREDFFKSKWVNELGVRLSYGLSGNIDKSTGPDIVAEAETDWITNMNYLRVTNPSNPELGWEKTYSWNVGVDAMFWDGRLNITADFYNKKSKNLLANVEIDPTIGWASVYRNSAEVVNRGVDLTLSGKLIDRAVEWDATLQFSYNKNKVTSLNYTPTLYGAHYGSPMLGQPVGYIAVHRYGGLDENGDPMFLYEDGGEPQSYLDLEKLTIDNLKFIGRTDPPVFGSLTTSLRFWDFTLGVMVNYKFGHKMHLPAPIPSMFGLRKEWYSEEYRWVEGDSNPLFLNMEKWVPKHSTDLFQDFNRADCLEKSDKLVDDADMIQLKSVSLAYDLTRWLNRIKIRGGEFRVSGENLAYWVANDWNLNPDQVIEGADGSYGVTFDPARPRVVFSLNLNF